MTTTTKKQAVPTPKRDSSTRKAPQARRDKFVSLDGMMTVEEWAIMPDVKPRYELVNGILIQKMTTTSRHAWTVGRLLSALMRWGDEIGWVFLPEGVGIKLGANDGAVADVSGFAPDAQLDGDATYFSQAPFLIVEVLSPSTAKRDRNAKKIGYEKIGVQLYLIVDPDRKTMEVHTLASGKYGTPRVLENSDVWQPEELKGLKLEVQKLWFA